MTTGPAAGGAAPVGLGIDAGGSSSRWLLLGEAGELGRGRLGPITGHLFAEPERSQVLARLDALVAAAVAVARPGAVVAGVTGLADGDAPARELAARLAAGLELPPERVVVRNDVPIAHAAAFPAGDGVLVYAGTGSVAYAERDGEAVRAGGHGYLIDDAGGGYWVGRAGLRAVLRRADARGAPAEGPLAEELYRALGTSDWDGVRAHVYGGGRQAVAALAPAVGAAAARGDAEALAILEGAGRELARLARVVLERLGGPRPVALAGGAARLGAPLVDALRAALPEGAELRESRAEPVEAAAALALGRARRAAAAPLD